MSGRPERYAVEVRYDTLTPWVLSSLHRHKIMAYLTVYFGAIEGFDYRIVTLVWEQVGD